MSARCKDHPDAPHGYDHNGSHNAGRYVCVCQAWEPDEGARMKVQELEGAELDAAVARAEGHDEIEVSSFTRGGEKRFRCEVVLPGEDGQTYWTEYQPSADWSVGGPIIECERIDVGPKGEAWTAHAGRGFATGPTPLIAAMRAYVASKEPA